MSNKIFKHNFVTKNNLNIYFISADKRFSNLILQRYEPFINKMWVKWQLTFFLLSFSGTPRFNGWRKNTRRFLEFSKIFIFWKLHFEYAYYLFYLNRFTSLPQKETFLFLMQYSRSIKSSNKHRWRWYNFSEIKEYNYPLFQKLLLH